MRLLGLSPAAFAAGLVALAGVLFALHLLRVRVRRVTVETLLFFRALGEVSRPRVLLGRPARWKAYALGLLALASLWAAFADPALVRGGRSRVILVDASGAAAAPVKGTVTGTTGDLAGRRVLDAHLRRARALVEHEGLGPNGAVLAFGGAVTTLLAAGEPTALLEFRAQQLVASGPGATFDAALGQARARLGEGGEVLLLGGPAAPPRTVGTLPVIRLPVAPSAACAGISGVTLEDWPQRKLVVEVVGPPGTVVLEGRLAGSGAERRELQLGPGAAAITEFPIPGEDRVEVTLAARLAGGTEAAAELAVRLPARVRIPVRLGPDLPEAVRLALEADPAFEVVAAAPEGRTVLEVRRDDIGPAQNPALLLLAGAEPAPRAAARTADCPIALGLRDLSRPAGTRLAPVPGETVWIVDRERGDPLVAAHLPPGGAPRVRMVEWLLEDTSHRDVPRLVAGSLRCLAGVRDAAVLAAGRPAAFAAPLRTPLTAAGTVWLPERGRHLVTLAGPGPVRIGDSLPSAALGKSRDLQVFAAAAPAFTQVAAEPELEGLAGPGRLLPFLLLLALCLLLLDAALFHAGRIP